MSYYTLLTTTGAAALANAQALGTTVDLTEVAVGDGGGVPVNPAESATALVHEVYRAPINQITTDPANPNWIVIEAIIPQAVGGWTAREVGVFDTGGNLIAIGSVPGTYKPQLAEGAASDLYLRVILQVSNASTVTLQIDPAIVLASRSYVDGALGAMDPQWMESGLSAISDLPSRLLIAGDVTGQIQLRRMVRITQASGVRTAEVSATLFSGGETQVYLDADVLDGSTIAKVELSRVQVDGMVPVLSPVSYGPATYVAPNYFTIGAIAKRVIEASIGAARAIEFIQGSGGVATATPVAIVSAGSDYGVFLDASVLDGTPITDVRAYYERQGNVVVRADHLADASVTGDQLDHAAAVEWGSMTYAGILQSPSNGITTIARAAGEPVGVFDVSFSAHHADREVIAVPKGTQPLIVTTETLSDRSVRLRLYNLAGALEDLIAPHSLFLRTYWL